MSQTDIGIRTASYTSEDRSWLASMHGTEFTPTVSLDLTAFASVATNGIVPSGIVLAKNTDTGKYVPYKAGDAKAGVARGLLWGYLNTQTSSNGHTPSISANNAMVVHGFVYQAKLPIKSAGDGFLDGAAKTALAQIYFA